MFATQALIKNLEFVGLIQKHVSTMKLVTLIDRVTLINGSHLLKDIEVASSISLLCLGSILNQTSVFCLAFLQNDKTLPTP